MCACTMHQKLPLFKYINQLSRATESREPDGHPETLRPFKGNAYRCVRHRGSAFMVCPCCASILTHDSAHPHPHQLCIHIHKAYVQAQHHSRDSQSRSVQFLRGNAPFDSEKIKASAWCRALGFQRCQDYHLCPNTRDPVVSIQTWYKDPKRESFLHFHIKQCV